MSKYSEENISRIGNAAIYIAEHTSDLSKTKITSNIPLIWNNATSNYILNIIIQIVISAISVKWFILSCKRASIKAGELKNNKPI